MVRWLGDIEQYDLTLKHIPGATNTASDALSRLCPMISSVDADTWLADYRVDPDFSALFSPTGDLLDAASMHRSRVWMEELFRVPLARTQEVVRNFHDGSTSGHRGTSKTLDLLDRRFIFPRMRHIFEEYVRSSPRCQKAKADQKSPRGLLHSVVLPIRRWQSISLDRTMVPPFAGYDCILTVTDRGTKMVHLIAAHSTDTSQDTAALPPQRGAVARPSSEYFFVPRCPVFVSFLEIPLCSPGC